MDFRPDADLLIIGARVAGAGSVDGEAQAKFPLEKPRLIEGEDHLVRQRADLETQAEFLPRTLENGMAVEQVEIGLAELRKERRPLQRAVPGTEADVAGARLLEGNLEVAAAGDVGAFRREVDVLEQ